MSLLISTTLYNDDNEHYWRVRMDAEIQEKKCHFGRYIIRLAPSPLKTSAPCQSGLRNSIVGYQSSTSSSFFKRLRPSPSTWAARGLTISFASGQIISRGHSRLTPRS